MTNIEMILKINRSNFLRVYREPATSNGLNLSLHCQSKVQWITYLILLY